MSAVYNITAENLRLAGYREIHAGDDYTHRFTVTRGGVALDLTSSTMWMTIKDSSLQSDAQAQLQLITPTAIELITPVDGVFDVHFSASDTEDLEGLYRYDIQVKLASAGNMIITIARGEIEFLENLSRSMS